MDGRYSVAHVGRRAGDARDGFGGDLHLLPTTVTAINEGVPLTSGLCDDDIDGEPRPFGPARDIGADEYTPPPPAAVRDLRVLQVTLEGSDLTVTFEHAEVAEKNSTFSATSRKESRAPQIPQPLR